eukprot:m51a1_g10168 hypothetical protein (2371) ;mRNA; r:89190-102652
MASCSSPLSVAQQPPAYLGVLECGLTGSACGEGEGREGCEAASPRDELPPQEPRGRDRPRRSSTGASRASAQPGHCVTLFSLMPPSVEASLRRSGILAVVMPHRRLLPFSGGGAYVDDDDDDYGLIADVASSRRGGGAGGEDEEEAIGPARATEMSRAAASATVERALALARAAAAQQQALDDDDDDDGGDGRGAPGAREQQRQPEGTAPSSDAQHWQQQRLRSRDDPRGVLPAPPQPPQPPQAPGAQQLQRSGASTGSSRDRDDPAGLAALPLPAAAVGPGAVPRRPRTASSSSSSQRPPSAHISPPPPSAPQRQQQQREEETAQQRREHPQSPAPQGAPLAVSAGYADAAEERRRLASSRRQRKPSTAPHAETSGAGRRPSSSQSQQRQQQQQQQHERRASVAVPMAEFERTLRAHAEQRALMRSLADQRRRDRALRSDDEDDGRRAGAQFHALPRSRAIVAQAAAQRRGAAAAADADVVRSTAAANSSHALRLRREAEQNRARIERRRALELRGRWSLDSVAAVSETARLSSSLSACPRPGGGAEEARESEAAAFRERVMWLKVQDVSYLSYQIYGAPVCAALSQKQRHLLFPHGPLPEPRQRVSTAGGKQRRVACADARHSSPLPPAPPAAVLPPQPEADSSAWEASLLDEQGVAVPEEEPSGLAVAAERAGIRLSASGLSSLGLQDEGQAEGGLRGDLAAEQSSSSPPLWSQQPAAATAEAEPEPDAGEPREELMLLLPLDTDEQAACDGATEAEGQRQQDEVLGGLNDVQQGLAYSEADDATPLVESQEDIPSLLGDLPSPGPQPAGMRQSMMIPCDEEAAAGEVVELFGDDEQAPDAALAGAELLLQGMVADEIPHEAAAQNSAEPSEGESREEPSEYAEAEEAEEEQEASADADAEQQLLEDEQLGGEEPKHSAVEQQTAIAPEEEEPQTEPGLSALQTAEYFEEAEEEQEASADADAEQQRLEDEQPEGAEELLHRAVEQPTVTAAEEQEESQGEPELSDLQSTEYMEESEEEKSPSAHAAAEQQSLEDAHLKRADELLHRAVEQQTVIAPEEQEESQAEPELSDLQSTENLEESEEEQLASARAAEEQQRLRDEHLERADELLHRAVEQQTVVAPEEQEESQAETGLSALQSTEYIEEAEEELEASASTAAEQQLLEDEQLERAEEVLHRAVGQPTVMAQEEEEEPHEEPVVSALQSPECESVEEAEYESPASAYVDEEPRQEVEQLEETEEQLPCSMEQQVAIVSAEEVEEEEEPREEPEVSVLQSLKYARQEASDDADAEQQRLEEEQLEGAEELLHRAVEQPTVMAQEEEEESHEEPVVSAEQSLEYEQEASVDADAEQQRLEEEQLEGEEFLAEVLQSDAEPAAAEQLEETEEAQHQQLAQEEAGTGRSLEEELIEAQRLLGDALNYSQEEPTVHVRENLQAYEEEAPADAHQQNAGEWQAELAAEPQEAMLEGELSGAQHLLEEEPLVPQEEIVQGEAQQQRPPTGAVQGGDEEEPAEVGVQHKDQFSSRQLPPKEEDEVDDERMVDEEEQEQEEFPEYRPRQDGRELAADDPRHRATNVINNVAEVQREFLWYKRTFGQGSAAPAEHSAGASGASAEVHEQEHLEGLCCAQPGQQDEEEAAGESMAPETAGESSTSGELPHDDGVAGEQARGLEELQSALPQPSAEEPGTEHALEDEWGEPCVSGGGAQDERAEQEGLPLIAPSVRQVSFMDASELDELLYDDEGEGTADISSDAPAQHAREDGDDVDNAGDSTEGGEPAEAAAEPEGVVHSEGAAELQPAEGTLSAQALPSEGAQEQGAVVEDTLDEELELLAGVVPAEAEPECTVTAGAPRTDAAAQAGAEVVAAVEVAQPEHQERAVQVADASDRQRMADSLSSGIEEDEALPEEPEELCTEAPEQRSPAAGEAVEGGLQGDASLEEDSRASSPGSQDEQLSAEERRSRERRAIEYRRLFEARRSQRNLLDVEVTRGDDSGGDGGSGGGSAGSSGGSPAGTVDTDDVLFRLCSPRSPALPSPRRDRQRMADSLSSGIEEDEALPEEPEELCTEAPEQRSPASGEAAEGGLQGDASLEEDSRASSPGSQDEQLSAEERRSRERRAIEYRRLFEARRSQRNLLDVEVTRGDDSGGDGGSGGGGAGSSGGSPAGTVDTDDVLFRLCSPRSPALPSPRRSVSPLEAPVRPLASTLGAVGALVGDEFAGYASTQDGGSAPDDDVDDEPLAVEPEESSAEAAEGSEQRAEAEAETGKKEEEAAGQEELLGDGDDEVLRQLERDMESEQNEFQRSREDEEEIPDDGDGDDYDDDDDDDAEGEQQRRCREQWQLERLVQVARGGAEQQQQGSLCELELDDQVDDNLPTL